MKNLLSLLLAAAMLPAFAYEWKLTEPDAELKVPHAPYQAFPKGFKATAVFSVDLAKTTPQNYQNLFTKGKDFLDGYSFMVRKDGTLLVDIKGIMPSYLHTDAKFESNREYKLETYVGDGRVRIFVDGKEVGSYSYYRTPDFSTTAPLKIGSHGGYRFFGNIRSFEIVDLDSVTMPPGGPKKYEPQPPKNQAIAEIIWAKRAICQEKDRYIGWPTVICTDKGTLIAAFSGDRNAHVCPFGRNEVVRSTDGGETWSKPVTVNNSIADDRDCGVTQLKSGEIMVTWFTDHTWDQVSGFWTKKFTPDQERYWERRHVEKLPPAMVKAACGKWCTRSKDDGLTWSKPEKLNTHTYSPHGPITLKNGDLFWMGRTGYREPEKRGLTRVSCDISADGGKTWVEPCYEVPDANGENSVPQMFHEPHAIELKDGRILSLVRYHGDDHCLRQTVSADGGRTWTPMQKTKMVGYPAHLLRLRDGRILATYSRRFPAPVGFGEYACVSADEGATWDVEHEIALAPHVDTDLGYPSTAQLPNGDLVSVFYQPVNGGEKPCLMATKWRLK